MKELLRKRLKKLTAFVLAGAMALLPGEGLLTAVAAEYSVEQVYNYYNQYSYYPRLLKEGDVLTSDDRVNTKYALDYPYIEDEEKTVLSYEEVCSRMEDGYSKKYYENLKSYFVGWEVSDVYISTGGAITTEVSLSPVYQYATVEDQQVLSTAETVTFTADIQHETYGTRRWGYAVPVGDSEIISEKSYFIDPDENKLYQFIPIGNENEPANDDSISATETLTLDLEAAKGKKIVFRMREKAQARSVQEDGYYYSNLAQVNIIYPYTVSYVKPDGTKLFDSETGYSNKDFAVNKTPAVEGYTFEGWYKNAQCTGDKVTSIAEGNKENVTLYAKLTKNPDPTPAQAPPTPSTEAPEKTYDYNAISASMTMGAKLYWNGNKLVIEWGAANGADGYEIFAIDCGDERMADAGIVKTVAAGAKKATIKKINDEKLNTSASYKIKVKAFVGTGAAKQYIGETLAYHSAGKNSKFTNAAKISVAKKNIVPKVGKSYKLSPKTTKQDKQKKLISENHAPEFRYLSGDTTVATVNKNGKIKAVGAGTCQVCVIAVNGVKAKVKVTVK